MQFEAVKNEAGLNRFVMTPSKWIEQMLFPWRNHEVSIIFLGHELKFYMDYDAEGGGKVLLNENDVEVVSLLQKMSNTRERTITLDVEMEDYYRLKNETEKA